MKNDNKLIAEFMGMEDHQEMGEYITPNYKTWEWLMPVVSKILTNENEEKKLIAYWKEIFEQHG